MPTVPRSRVGRQSRPTCDALAALSLRLSVVCSTRLTPRSRSAAGILAVALLAVVLGACGRSAPERVVAAQAPAAGQSRADRGDPTTNWSDERIRDFWKQVEAGPSLKPAAWPNGATAAVAL